MESIEIINGDCLVEMKKLDDESIDLVVTDCPYKIIAGGVTIEEKQDEISGVLRKRAVSDGTACSNKWIKKNDTIPSAVKAGKMFTHNEITFKQWLPEVFRVLKQKSHCYIMVNARNLKELQTESEKIGFKFQNILIWDKGNVTPNKYYMGGYECILMLRKGGAKNINNMGTSNILRVPNIIGNKLHPTEKPVGLLRIMIENSTDENDIVLDPFSGSGSTGVACIQSKRRFKGIEIDNSFYNISTERLNTYSNQLRIF